MSIYLFRRSFGDVVPGKATLTQMVNFLYMEEYGGKCNVIMVNCVTGT